MSEKVKETDQEKEQEQLISMTVYVPLSVHRILKIYETRIENERKADFTIAEVYAEALKEFTKTVAI
jgi:transcriptional regulator of met regulon